MNQESIIPFIKSTRHIFRTLFQMSVETGSPSAARNTGPTYDIAASVELTGDVTATVALSFPPATALRVVGLFTGKEAQSAAPESVGDAIGELAEMIVGGARSQLKDKRITISCPTVSVGADRVPRPARGAVAIAIPCLCDCGEFAIDVAFAGDDAPDQEPIGATGVRAGARPAGAR